MDPLLTPRRGRPTGLRPAHVLCALLALALCLAPTSLRAQDAAAEREIRIGMSGAFSGPNQSMGRSVRHGIEACFRRVNAEGGVHGRALRLIALDDGYVPEVAESNTRRLVDEEDVLALVGSVGTPTAERTLPIVRERGVLMLGAVTGAGLLRRTPPDRHVINLRASYAQEMARIVDGLLGAGVRPHEIAFFTQDDGYGTAGYEGAIAALERAGYPHGRRLAHGRYPRNTLDIGAGLQTILEAADRPRAVVTVGTYAPCAKLIRVARRQLPYTWFVNVSFVSCGELAEALGEDVERVVVTQVMPHPGSAAPVCADYRRDLAEAFPGRRTGFVSLEGYVAARLLVDGLRAAGPDVTRESLVDAIEGIDKPSDWLGAPVRFGPDRHQGCEQVWPMAIEGGRLVPFEWERIARTPERRAPPERVPGDD